MTDFPLWVDNSALSTFRSCEKKAEYEFFRQIEPLPPSVHLHAGGAFARGLEVARKCFYVKGLPAELSLAKGLEALWVAYGNFECPEDSAKSWEGMSRALVAYLDTWKLGEDYVKPLPIGDTHSIEFSFAVPLEIKHPTTGDPILYTGRADMIGQFRDSLFNVDEKTTKGIGPTWARQWALRSQFMGYTWAARKYGLNVVGTLVRGIAILKTEIKTAEAHVYHADHLIANWLDLTLETIERMIFAWKRGKFRLDYGHACSSYSGCPFMRLCESPDPERWITPAYYGKRAWNPLHKPDGIEAGK